MDLTAFSQKRICVGLSGGVDSVVLLCYLKEQQAACGYVLSAVHCEHGIRGEESLGDMRFVQALCDKWRIPLTVFSENCPARAKREKESLETAARSFRYESFDALFKEEKADYIALAHHKDDDAETVLFRLLRGSSLTGVGGMSLMNGRILRPLLDWTREDILEYAHERGLNWREDKTNFERGATRNQLRLDVFPMLERSVPGSRDNLVRFAALAKEDDALLYEYASVLVHFEQEEVLVDFCEKAPLFRRACLLAFKALGLTRDYTALHLEKAYALQSLTRGSRLDLPQNIVAERREKYVAFYKKKPPVSMRKSAEKPFDVFGYDGGRYLVSVSTTPPEESGNGWKTLRLDGDKIPEGAVYRFRQEGDRIERFGGGTKTLKKFFNEKKIASAEREWLPLIAKGNEVYAVCGVEISEKVKITPETKNSLYLAIKENDHVERS